MTSLVFTQERKSSLQQRIWFVKLPEAHFFGGVGGCSVLFLQFFTYLLGKEPDVIFFLEVADLRRSLQP